MRKYLLFWRDLTKEQKVEHKKQHNIKVVTFEFIKSIYLKPL